MSQFPRTEGSTTDSTMGASLRIFWVCLWLVGLGTLRCFAADPNVPTDSNDVADSNTVASFLQPEKRTDIIRSLEFEGNKNSKFKSKTLKKRVGIELGERFDPFLAEGGRRTILDVYRKIGYAFVEAEWDRELAKVGTLHYVIVEGPRVKIKKVRVKGTKVYNAYTLKKLLRNRKRKWYGETVYYTDQAVRDDAEKLRDFYYRHGYLGYSVTTDTEFTSDRKGAIVTFRIEEGPPYHIDQIIFSGNALTADEKLHAKLEIKPGQVYSRDRADRDARHMLERYREFGFIEAQVVQGPRFKPDTDEHVVNVEFVIQEGHQFRIGRIDVSGNELCQDKVVRRVLDEYDFSPGELYNGAAVSGQGDSLLERYVKRVSLAEEVVIRPVEASSGDPNQKDVRVDMTEGMTGMIMPGIGISSDDGLMGQLIYQQRNFDITDWPQSWKDFFTMKGFRGAGQNMRIALEPGTQVSRYSISLTEPYFFDRPIDSDFTASQYGRWFEAYNEHRTSALVGFEHRKWGRWRKSIRFRAENVKVLDVESNAPSEITSVQGHNAVYGVTLGTGLTKLDDIYMPTDGYNFRVAYEQGAGDFIFGALTAKYVYYIPLYEDVLERRTVLATRVSAGQMFGDAPMFEKFYAGGMGQYSVRGFDFRGISTRDSSYQTEYPIGSDWVVTAGSEIVIPLIEKNFSGVVFLDAGIIDTGGWRYSTGLGLQILVPQWFGPVPMRFEYGYPMQYDQRDETRRFNFSMGALF